MILNNIISFRKNVDTKVLYEDLKKHFKDFQFGINPIMLVIVVHDRTIVETKEFKEVLKTHNIK